jgi:thioredoxin reductase
VHGFISRDGISPSELLDLGRSEVRGYGAEVISGEVSAVARKNGGFAVTMTDGQCLRARRLLIATGLGDELPDLPGLRERWGRDVIHCPYCHGWEVRDKAIAVLATGPMAVHQALLFRQLSTDVTFFSHTMPPDQREELTARDIRIVDGPVASVEIADDRVVGVRLDDGTTINADAVVVSPRMVARGEFLASLGLRPAEHPAGSNIPADATGRTEVPGVWVAGNVTDLMAQVGGSAAAGALAGAHINADLVAEETSEAVAAFQSAA